MGSREARQQAAKLGRFESVWEARGLGEREGGGGEKRREERQKRQRQMAEVVLCSLP